MDKRIVLIALVGLIVLNISCTNKTISHQRQQNDSLIVQEKADSLEKSDSLFDGDPNVSGSTRLIGAIMKSIADGDANTLASLAIYPIERRYPLHNITSSSDMVKRFAQIFDQKFRDRMKSTKPSNWHSYG